MNLSTTAPRDSTLMKTLAIVLGLALSSCVTVTIEPVDPVVLEPASPELMAVYPEDVRVGELLSRRKYDDYDACTYSFEHGVQLDPDRSITRNDWDIQFGNGGDVFDVTMVTDDRSRIVDLGPSTWADLDFGPHDVPVPHAEPDREPTVAVRVGHIYVVRTVDGETDITTLLRVESLVPGDRVTFTWKPY